MPRILIIEDDPYVRRFYQRLFTLGKYEVELGSNGEEGLEKVESFRPDLIILDILMPKLNGMEMLNKLKKDPKHQNIPVLILTNLEDEETSQKALAVGANAYLLKSDMPPENIISYVDKYLPKRQ